MQCMHSQTLSPSLAKVINHVAIEMQFRIIEKKYEINL